MTTTQRLRIILPVAIVAGIGTWWALRTPADPRTIAASGTVEAVEADLGFQQPGRITRIAVEEGRRVEVGQVIAELDRAELDARQRAARAQLAAARAALTELLSGFRTEEVAQGRAALRTAERRLTDAERDLERTQRLYDGGALSRQVLDDAQTARQVAEAARDQAAEALRILETGPRAERVAVQRALVQQADAAVAEIDAAAERTTIVAPFAGVVTVRHREPGEIVAAGSPVVTVMNPADRWVRIYLRQDVVGRIALGTSVTLAADAFPERVYEGEVSFIANEAEFTPRNVQTAEERVKLVYRVKVRIISDPSFDLKPGLVADVTVPPTAP